jgi:hypothetical protein
LESKKRNAAPRNKAAKNTRIKPKATKQDPLARLSIDKLEDRIEQIQRRLREIDTELVDPDVYTDGRKSKKLQSERGKLTKDLEPLDFEWARRAEENGE